jgi:hypothetical protein
MLGNNDPSDFVSFDVLNKHDELQLTHILALDSS